MPRYTLNRRMKQLRKTKARSKGVSLRRPNTSEENFQILRKFCVKRPKMSIARRRLALGRIITANETVTPEMLNRTLCEIDYCLYVCRATNGTHIQT